MVIPTKLSQLMESRLSRYAMVAGTVAAAAVPASAAPISVVVEPTFDIRDGYLLDLDQNGTNDFIFTGAGSFFVASGIPTGPATGTQVGQIEIYAGPGTLAYEAIPFSQALINGLPPDSTYTFHNSAHMALFSATGTNYLALRMPDSNGIYRYGFVQFDPFLIQGFAYDPDGTSIRTFDVVAAAATAAPEPGTSALAGLALGALGLAASRRKKQQ